jgi:hypothetical protein
MMKRKLKTMAAEARRSGRCLVGLILGAFTLEIANEIMIREKN